MKFYCDEVVLVSVNEFKSKSGNDLCILKIADPASYENVEFFPSRGFDFSGLQPGSFYKAILDFDGRYSSIELEEIK